MKKARPLIDYESARFIRQYGTTPIARAMTQQTKEYLDFRLYVIHETEKAMLVSETLSREDAFWLPRSQISYEETGVRKGKIIEVDIRVPLWLATEKGLV